MRMRRIAVLVDGGFFLKRIKWLVREPRRDTPEKVAELVRLACRSHVTTLTGIEKHLWLDQVYRIFYYDAEPWSGQAHHPLLNRQIDFGKSDEATFRRALFDRLRQTRKVAVRLGKVTREGDWSPPTEKVRKILATKGWFEDLDFSQIAEGGVLTLTAEQVQKALALQKRWTDIRTDEVRLGLRQKGVDMRIGTDIAALTLKKQVDTIILITGDSDFVPAAKLARREGVEFILDPLWQQVNADLFEHIDGLRSGLTRPRHRAAAGDVGADDDIEL